MKGNKYYYLYLEQKRKKREQVVKEYNRYLKEGKPPKVGWALIKKDHGISRPTLYSYLKIEKP